MFLIFLLCTPPYIDVSGKGDYKKVDILEFVYLLPTPTYAYAYVLLLNQWADHRKMSVVTWLVRSFPTLVLIEHLYIENQSGIRSDTSIFKHIFSFRPFQTHDPTLRFCKWFHLHSPKSLGWRSHTRSPQIRFSFSFPRITLDRINNLSHLIQFDLLWRALG